MLGAGRRHHDTLGHNVGATEDYMGKGRHRRHQQARELKHQTAQPMYDGNNEPAISHEAGDETECDECLRWPHADWCRAEEEDVDEDDTHDA